MDYNTTIVLMTLIFAIINIVICASGNWKNK